MGKEKRRAKQDLAAAYKAVTGRKDWAHEDSVFQSALRVLGDINRLATLPSLGYIGHTAAKIIPVYLRVVRRVDSRLAQQNAILYIGAEVGGALGAGSVIGAGFDQLSDLFMRVLGYVPALFNPREAYADLRTGVDYVAGLAKPSTKVSPEYQTLKNRYYHALTRADQEGVTPPGHHSTLDKPFHEFEHGKQALATLVNTAAAVIRLSQSADKYVRLRNQGILARALGVVAESYEEIAHYFADDGSYHHQDQYANEDFAPQQLNSMPDRGAGAERVGSLGNLVDLGQGYAAGLASELDNARRLGNNLLEGSMNLDEAKADYAGIAN